MVIAQGRMDHTCRQGASSTYKGPEEGVMDWNPRGWGRPYGRSVTGIATQRRKMGQGNSPGRAENDQKCRLGGTRCPVSLSVNMEDCKRGPGKDRRGRHPNVLT